MHPLTYEREVHMVAKRWEAYQYIKLDIFRGLKWMAIMIILTAVMMPEDKILGVVCQIVALLLVMGFGKWLIKRGAD